MARRREFGGEVLTFEVGRGAAAIGEALWRRHEDDDDFVEAFPPPKHDPMRGKDGLPRSLIFDARQPEPFKTRLAVDVGLATFSQDTTTRAMEASYAEAKAIRRRGVAVPAPFFAGTENVFGFNFYADGLREGGVLGTTWWDATEDLLRRQLETCDAPRGALFLVDASAGGFAGVAGTLLTDVEDELGRNAVKAVYYCPDDASYGGDDSNDRDGEPSTTTTKKSTLRDFASAFAFRHLHEPAQAIVPIDPRPDAVAEAIDLTTLPFRRINGRVGLREWRDSVAGDDPTKKLASLLLAEEATSSLAAAAGDHTATFLPLFSPWKANSETSPFTPSEEQVVAVYPSAAACVPADERCAVPFLRTLAAKFHTRGSLNARRAAAHFGLQLDDLDEIYTELVRTAGFYINRSSAYSFPEDDDDDDEPPDDAELFE